MKITLNLTDDELNVLQNALRQQYFAINESHRMADYAKWNKAARLCEVEQLLIRNIQTQIMSQTGKISN